MALEEIEPGTVIEGFALKTPDNESCNLRVAHNVACGPPDLLSRKPLAVIAAGPSAREVDLASLRTPTLALNGALALFTDCGLAPTYWACIDSQEIVADYLPDDPPQGTTYLVASKCHPRVFEKLRGRNVRLWHLPDYPAPGRLHQPLCCSVTLCATWLMTRLGYTDFDYWGWDGCYFGDLHHAADARPLGVDQVFINYGGKLVGGEIIGGRTFTTTRTWAAEAQSAEQFFQLAKYFDIGVTLHGDGMFKHAREAIFAQQL